MPENSACHRKSEDNKMPSASEMRKAFFDQEIKICSKITAVFALPEVIPIKLSKQLILIFIQ